MKKAEVQIPDKQWQILTTLHFESSLNSVFGLWQNRKDINSAENYIRKLRKGKRLEMFYAKNGGEGNYG